ncbi:MAG: antitoxin [Acidimicrobiales bacterium]
MPRTTLDLDASVLRELKRRRQTENKTLGQLASELLATAMAEGPPRSREPVPLKWTSKNLRPRVDLEDKDAVWAILDGR